MTINRASFRTWGLLTVSFASVACLVEYASNPRSGWVRGYWDWGRFGFAQFGETARSLVAAALTLLLGSGLAAGVVQTVVRRYGRGPDADPSQAADYDDAPPPPPPG
jgi:hypothetical protein